jgi:peroxiredoxin
MQLDLRHKRRVAPLMLALASFLVVAPASARADDLGPSVGTVAPSIGSPLDETGKPRSFAGLSGPKGLVLLFFRSAAWCPYCQAQLMDINGGAPGIEKRGYRVAALSYDKPEVTAAFKAKRNIAFTFLSDPRSEVIDRYGLRDPQYAPGSMAYGVPRPIIFILDPTGRIQAKLFEATFRTRPPVTAVIAKIDEVGGTN